MSSQTKPSTQMQATTPPPRALDWPPPCPPLDLLGLTLDLDVTTEATTLDELPISANSSLPEYQLTQEWFERILEELREVDESEDVAAVAVAAAAVTGEGDVETDVVDGDVEAEAGVAIEDGHTRRHQEQLDW